MHVGVIMKPNLMPEDIAVYMYQDATDVPRANRLRDSAAHYAASRGLACNGDFTVERQPGKKPFFPAQRELHFSISHSGAYWLVAFHGRELGLDIQQHKTRSCAAIAKRWFHADEYAAVLQHGDTCFFAIWSAKESLCKANGQGINAAFPHFCVAGPGGNLLERCCSWQLRPFALAEGYSACLCAAEMGQVHIIYP